MNSIMFSQTIVLNSSKDTTMCFSINQARFLLKNTLKVSEYTEKIDLYKEVISGYKSNNDRYLRIIEKDSLSKVDYKSVIKKGEEKNLICKQLNESLEASNKEKDKSIKRQKFYKWTFIIIGGASTSYMTYLNLKK
jgi:hypothetical protein